jgi:hypothetical protein
MKCRRSVQTFPSAGSGSFCFFGGASRKESKNFDIPTHEGYREAGQAAHPIGGRRVIMKTTHYTNGLWERYSGWLRRLVEVTVLLAGSFVAQGQGTITYNAHPYFAGTNYVELGMQFRVIIPTPGDYDVMGGIPAGGLLSNNPYNSTPYMIFIRQSSPDDYVVFSLTNGYSFGLTSVYLADPNSPSSAQVPIMFEGFKADGSIVTNIFTTPGNGATNLQNYSFSSDFLSGLTSVEIQAPRWAMDNLVFGNVEVPEPAVGSLFVAALLMFGGWKLRKRCMT